MKQRHKMNMEGKNSDFGKMNIIIMSMYYDYN